MSKRNEIASALGVALTPIGIAAALVIAAISLSASGWVGAVVYGLAGLLLLVGVILGWMRWPRKEPPAPRRPLFSVRLPEPPKTGHIGNYKTVWFDKVLVTKRAEGDRVLQFALSMPGIEFVDLGNFQAIYLDQPSIHDGYHPNPLSIPGDPPQKVLAFVHARGSEGIADTFELSIDDVTSGQSFVASELGEHIFYDDGSVDHDSH